MGINERIKCAYLGPKGTFSEMASIRYFKEEANFIPVSSISEVFDKVREKLVDFGIVPIENSVEGSVNMSMDLLSEVPDILVVGECVVPVRHFLVSFEDIDLQSIKKVYSHQQAIGQCSKFIKNKLNHPEIIFTASTAVACELIKEETNSAAIASENVIKIYNPNVLAKDIQDSDNNLTRFFVITSSKNSPPLNKDLKYKTSIICSPKHNRAGVLYSMLESFQKKNINLTRIESRPTKKQLGEYLFYIDFEGHINDEGVKEALRELKEMSSFFKILGSYPIW